MKILSFDIEEWYIEKVFRGNEQWKLDAYDAMLDRVLELLDRYSVRATFFCVGEMARMFPHVVKTIAAGGHEIGCHSMAHTWLTTMDIDRLARDTTDALSALRDCTGCDVVSYRAPAFSICESNMNALETLADCGIKNDASIFPGVRDFGGFPSFGVVDGPSVVHCGDALLNEFPITLEPLPFIGKKIAYSGGGYFRLLPLSFVRSRMARASYVMCYFHLADLVDFRSRFMTADEYQRYFKQPGTLKNRVLRYVKSNVGRKRSFAGLSSLLDNYQFVSVREAARSSESFQHKMIYGKTI